MKLNCEQLPDRECPAFVNNIEVMPDWHGPITAITYEDKLIVGAGVNGGPRVTITDIETGKEEASFYAYEPTFMGGVNVVVTDRPPHRIVNENVLLVGTNFGGSPRVVMYTTNGVFLDSYFVGNETLRNGIDVTKYINKNNADVKVIIKTPEQTGFKQTDFDYYVGFGKQLIISLEIEESFEDSDDKLVGFMFDLYYKIIDNNIVGMYDLTIGTSNAPSNILGFNPLVIRVYRSDNLDIVYNKVITVLGN